MFRGSCVGVIIRRRKSFVVVGGGVCGGVEL